jgi:hypothetical protein
MTCLEKLSKANRWRVRTGKMGSDESAGWNGAFIVPLEGEMWQVLLSDGMGWRHLSITNAQTRELPSWNIMCRVKELFFGDDEWAIQYHPPKADYINDHPFVLHLWQPLNEKLPIPFNVMV